MLQGFEQSLGHGFVVLASVANVGKDLGQCLLVVDFAEVAVLREVLLIGVVGVDVGGGVVAIGLAVDEALQGQAVAECAFLGRPANGECGDGHDETRELEDVDNLLGLIDGGA